MNAQFKRDLVRYATDQGWPEILDGSKIRKLCSGEYALYWQDGQIYRRDIYHYNKRTITLFDTHQRYSPNEKWFRIY